MDPYICLLPIIPIRKEPSHRAEQLSQLIFGEKLIIQEEKKEWVRILTRFDRYEGWAEKSALTRCTEDHSDIMILSDPLIRAICDDESIYLPAGSEIPVPDEKGIFELEGISFRLTKNPEPAQGTPSGLAVKFLHSPYLWGGRTLLGIDCSGFVQIVFKILGIPLLRDARDQANEGEKVAFDALRENDLAFFQENGRVTHVGIFMGGGKIIHASKMVRIDKLDKKGIYNEDLRSYTHELHSIRRLVKV